MWRKIKYCLMTLLNVYCREFKLVAHDAGIILFFLFLPLAYPVIYSLIYNPEVVRDVKMVVVDHDRSRMSRELARNMDATQEAWVIGYAADLAEARRAVNSHEAYAILEIPEGFGRKIGRGEQANAVIYCETSLLLRYRGFLMASTSVSGAMGAEIMTRKIDEVIPIAETMIDGDLMPVVYEPQGNIESGFDSFIMPGVLILILHQCIILASGMAGGAKCEHPGLAGHVPGQKLPPVSLSMAGEMLCYFTVLFIPAIFLLHYVPLIFSFPMENNILSILAFVLPIVIACFGLGFVVQAFVRERETIFVIWVVTSVIFLFLSGLTWPRYAMSPLWYWIGNLVPATWGVEGFIVMNSNGASLSQVVDYYIPLWILAGVYLLLGYCAQRWVVRKSIVSGKDSYERIKAEAI